MAMKNLKWDFDAWEEYLDWYKKDKAIFRRINALIKDMMRDPHRGIGKPEALKGNLSGLRAGESTRNIESSIWQKRTRSLYYNAKGTTSKMQQEDKTKTRFQQEACFLFKAVFHSDGMGLFCLPYYFPMSSFAVEVKSSRLLPPTKTGPMILPSRLR